MPPGWQPPGQQSAPPGWYPDPWMQGPLRYFDGVNWTPSLSGHPYGNSPPSEPDAVVKWLVPVGRSGLSIAAGYVGLFSILLAPAPIALLLGILALRDINRRPGMLGKGRAIFAIIMGGLFSVVLLIALVAGNH